MIFVSSSCVKNKSILSSIYSLLAYGIKNIELSGGTEFEENLLSKILVLKQQHDLNFRVHNYFPPPKEHFVLNLASLNDSIFSRTVDFYKESIRFCIGLGIDTYSLHAGFFVDPHAESLGKKFCSLPVFNRTRAFARFCGGVDVLQKEFPQVKLYVENNALSKENYSVYKSKVLMLLDSQDWFELKDKLKCGLLLDIGHLKVTAKTLGLPIGIEMEQLSKETDYFHLSDNDGCNDQNLSLSNDSEIWGLLAGMKLGEKTLTLEVYENLSSVKNCIEKLEKF
jgi:sugar phosphate isomerase/epimerase